MATLIPFPLRRQAQPLEEQLEAIFELSITDPVAGALVDAVGYEYLLDRYLGEAVADPFVMAEVCTRLHRRKREATRWVSLGCRISS